MFEKIKKDILGKSYELSIALVAEKKSREINKKYRKKDKATNVLSFAFSKNSGELVLCPAVIRHEAKNLDRPYRKWLGFLVIHGMLHLKGMKHSSTMERAEKKYEQKYFSGNRRGILHDEDRGGRIFKRRKKS
ncbi:rRNA maturation RNase YbeY [Candidatus Nomurabacteria bacterium RIFCSPLOWO2_01_FULL_42_17]|uniref:Endoribonuclease YbeY n=1 Tax=Candidatus Nomurabacteria bacterium RIFCSPLOWO2_01_FULL_42_17 TaxID=1801780 RepID=A0A1F6XMD6_9BACT|nr:MAG: rRNA maturation RNase YbeY [Candidatus Nomurabacteria bacterium RIFCSPLOWO2_01_FULL_42_17]